MKSIVRSLLAALVVAVLLAGMPHTSQAATDFSLSVSGDFTVCDPDVLHVITFGWTATTFDIDSEGDNVGVLAFDANGVSIAGDWGGFDVGVSSTHSTPFGNGQGINTVTAWPVTIQIKDLAGQPPYGHNTQTIYDSIEADSGPIVIQTTLNCGSTPEALPGCDVTIAIPSTAVGGTFVADAPLYWTPGQLVSPAKTIPAGESARVIGLDESGKYYKIIWVCDYVWVPANALGPNFDAVWHGAPLPTGVVK
jgi:hypothetical protein